MIEPFLITGLGASGTRWLTKFLDQSTHIHARHEPALDPWKVLHDMHDVVVVDSRLRHHPVCKDFARSGRLIVLTRHPVEIALHSIRKRTIKRVREEWQKDWSQIDRLLNIDGTYQAHFDKLTSRQVHRDMLCEVIGIPGGLHDVPREGHIIPRQYSADEAAIAIGMGEEVRHMACKWSISRS